MAYVAKWPRTQRPRSGGSGRLPPATPRSERRSGGKRRRSEAHLGAALVDGEARRCSGGSRWPWGAAGSISSCSSSSSRRPRLRRRSRTDVFGGSYRGSWETWGGALEAEERGECREVEKRARQRRSRAPASTPSAGGSGVLAGEQQQGRAPQRSLWWSGEMGEVVCEGRSGLGVPFYRAGRRCGRRPWPMGGRAGGDDQPAREGARQP
jgi:hypothetical protein